MKNRRGIIDKYVWLRLCWSEGLGHINIPLQIWSFTSMLLVLVKLYNVSIYWVLLLVSLIVLAIVALGYFSLKKGVTWKQIGAGNQYNPQLLEILEEVKKIKHGD